MGQKTNPISNRIGITRGWDSNWCGGNYAEKIAEDFEIRKYLTNRLSKASLSKIVIERTLKLITVTIHAARPGFIIGKGGAEVDKLKEELKKVTKKDPDYPVGYTEIQTTGTNGSVITVVRTVKDSQGNVIREDEFTSEYDPKDEVTLVGTGGTDGSGSGEDGSSGEGDE